MIFQNCWAFLQSEIDCVSECVGEKKNCIIYSNCYVYSSTYNNNWPILILYIVCICNMLVMYVLKHTYLGSKNFFRYNMFMLNEMFQQNASCHFLEIRKPNFFIVHFVLLYFPSNECPGLYWQLAKINNFWKKNSLRWPFRAASFEKICSVVSSNGNLFAESFWWKLISRIFFHFYLDFRALCNSIQWLF